MKVLWLIPIPIDNVFQNTSRSEAAGALAKHGIEVETIGGYYNHPVNISGFSKIHYMHMNSDGLLGKLQSLLRLMKMICHIPSDVIIFSVGLAFLIPVLRFYYFITCRRKILVTDIRSLIVPEENHKISLWPSRFRICMIFTNWFADMVTVITPNLKQSIIKYLPRKKNDILVWESGVNCDIFNSQKANSIKKDFARDDDFIVVYHGVLGKTRGLQKLVRAFYFLRDIRNIKLLLIGDGDGRAESEQISRENNLTDRVLFTGKVSYTDIPNYLASVDLAVIPLPNDECWNVSSPLKLMEYLSMGVPVIATNIESHSRVINSLGGGVLIEDNNPKSIAQAIRSVFYKKVVIPQAKNDVRDFISWDAKTSALAKYLNTIGTVSNNK